MANISKYKVFKEDDTKPVKAWVDGVPFEQDAKRQLLNLARLPFIYRWVAAMSDAHVGKGATVGSVIPTKGAIIPAAVGVDIGCFTGDTEVLGTDGNGYRMDNLEGEEIDVFSYSSIKEKIVVAKASCHKTRKQATLVAVTLDSGDRIRCTPDHEFMIRDGSFKRADQLNPHSKLMSCYSIYSKEREIKNLGDNHTVVSVEFIDDTEDVYCLNVPKYKNFALASGIFVHNCGMNAVRTTLTSNDLPENTKQIREAIEKYVPHGRTDNGGKNDRGAWGNTPSEVDAAWMGLEPKYRKMVDKHPKIKHRREHHHLGTLGGGNHFIEACLDEEGYVWFMLHSGSRGVGNRIGQYFIELAKKDMEKYFIHLPDKELAYFPEGTDHFNDYTEAILWAQEFAKVSRELMMENTIKAVASVRKKLRMPKFEVTDFAVNVHHNYSCLESHYGENVWVTRKGAVRARENDLSVLPGSMGAKSFIVRGKGNPESFHSCSHGAGRVMSRRAARESITLKQHREETHGVECKKDKDVIDESPSAYKNIDDVMEAQSDLVEVVHTLKQFVCVKG